jgi:hypothetical protein
MKSLLFHAIPAATHQLQFDWNEFLREAANYQLPRGAEQLAENVWLLPDDDRTYRDLAKLGHQHAIETRVRPIVHVSDWQRLSPPP